LQTAHEAGRPLLLADAGGKVESTTHEATRSMASHTRSIASRASIEDLNEEDWAMRDTETAPSAHDEQCSKCQVLTSKKLSVHADVFQKTMPLHISIYASFVLFTLTLNSFLPEENCVFNTDRRLFPLMLTAAVETTTLRLAIRSQFTAKSEIETAAWCFGVGYLLVYNTLVAFLVQVIIRYPQTRVPPSASAAACRAFLGCRISAYDVTREPCIRAARRRHADDRRVMACLPSCGRPRPDRLRLLQPGAGTWHLGP